MNRLTSIARFIALALVCSALFGACTPKYLVGADMVNGRYVKYTLQLISWREAYGPYTVVVCDIDKKSGHSAECVETGVLDNVVSVRNGGSFVANMAR